MLISDSEPFTEKEIEEIIKLQNVKNVEKAYNITSFNTNKITYKDETISIIMLGTVSSNITSENIKEGKFPKKNEILIDEQTKNSLGKNIIGEKVNLAITIDKKTFDHDFIISGVYGRNIFWSNG